MGLSQNEIDQERVQVSEEIKVLMNELHKAAPSVTEGLAAVIGSSLGAGGSIAALSFLGVSGLSAAGITSGLATAGALVGGGMVAGISVLAAPVAVLGIAGYAFAKKKKQAKTVAALNTAIKKLYEIQSRLKENAQYFQEQLAYVNATLDYLEKELEKRS